MHTLQTLLETYAVDWQGKYPVSLNSLKSAASQPGREYWKDFTNPFTGKSGIGHALLSMDQLPDSQFRPLKYFWDRREHAPKDAGLVIYLPVRDSQNHVTRYFLYGLDRSGLPIRSRDTDLTLSNDF